MPQPGHATRIGRAQLPRLEALNDDVRASIDTGTPTCFLRANRAFHTVVLEAAQSPRLAADADALVEQPVVRRTAQRYGGDEFQRSHAEHAALVEAFRARDPIWAEAR
jgi:DNA-binding GntR family transcriptional regulator